MAGAGADFALFVLQQLFNLFYAIGDILVYYIPLYLIACIWAGFGAYGLATGLQRFDAPSPSTPESSLADQSSADSDAVAKLPTNPLLAPSHWRHGAGTALLDSVESRASYANV